MECRNRGANRIALLVQYDGTCFNGSQIQNGRRTIQEILENAIRILTGENPCIAASGRTDTGVHAIGQVIHFDLDKKIKLQRLCIGLNGILPFDVSIKNAYFVNDDFHARYSAVEREYLYLIYNYPLRTPFMKYRAMWESSIIDVDFIKQAASYFIGEHDFASFCKKKSSGKNTIRKINEITVNKSNDIVQIKIIGNAFLHNMIRIIVGTVVEIHKSGKDPEYIKVIIKKKDRNFAGKTAPPYGLYLSRVSYDPQLSAFESAF